MLCIMIVIVLRPRNVITDHGVYDFDSLLLNNKMQLFCFYVSCYVTNHVFYMLELHELYNIRCVRVLSHTDIINTLLLFNNNSVAERFTKIYQFIMYRYYYLYLLSKAGKL